MRAPLVLGGSVGIISEPPESLPEKFLDPLLEADSGDHDNCDDSDDFEQLEVHGPSLLQDVFSD